MPRQSPSTTRRTALGGLVAGVLLLSGCDREDLLPPDADPESEPPTTPDAHVDPDQARVDMVVQEVSGAWLLVSSARAYPALRQVLGPLQHLHEAHLDVLDAPPDQAPVPMTGGAARKYQEVRRMERLLMRQLADASVRVDSGALAKLLASMSAAVAQRLTAMPETIVPSDGGPR